MVMGGLYKGMPIEEFREIRRKLGIK